MQSCSDDKVYTVKEVMDAHPDAHSILFFLPETSHIAEGDKSAKVRKLDYITFSYGYVIVKFVGEDELKLFLDEPSFGGDASMLYSSEKENNSFFVRIDNCVFFEEDNGELIASYATKADEARMLEYMNLLISKGITKTPRVIKRLTELANNKSDPYYPFN